MRVRERRKGGQEQKGVAENEWVRLSIIHWSSTVRQLAFLRSSLTHRLNDGMGHSRGEMHQPALVIVGKHHVEQTVVIEIINDDAAQTPRRSTPLFTARSGESVTTVTEPELAFTAIIGPGGVRRIRLRFAALPPPPQEARNNNSINGNSRRHRWVAHFGARIPGWITIPSATIFHNQAAGMKTVEEVTQVSARWLSH